MAKKMTRYQAVARILLLTNEIHEADATDSELIDGNIDEIRDALNALDSRVPVEQKPVHA